MTGQELYTWWRQNTDVAFSVDPGPAKVNRLFRRALLNIVERIYTQRLVNQNEFDKIKYMIRSERPFIPGNNKLYLGKMPISSAISVAAGVNIDVTFPLPHNVDALTVPQIRLEGLVDVTPTGATPISGQNGILNTGAIVVVDEFTIRITTSGAPVTNNAVANAGLATFYDDGAAALNVPDYRHHLTTKVDMLNPLYDIVISDLTNTTPIKAIFEKPTKFRTGMQMVISGAAGNTAANGTWYVKALSNKQYLLYSDEDLQTASAGNGVYVSGSKTEQVSELISEYTRQKVSDEKIGRYGAPDVRTPRHEEAEMALIIHPKNRTCNLVSMDYIIAPPFEIDVENSDIDLQSYYPDKLLFEVAAEASKLYAGAYRDGEGTIISTNEIVENP